MSAKCWHKGYAPTYGVSKGVFSVQEIWAVGIARAVKKTGESVETALEVSRLLMGMTPNDIESAMSELRSCVFLVNGNVIPLLCMRSTYASEYIQGMIHEAMNAGLDAAHSVY